MLKSADEIFDYLGSFVNFEKKQKQSIRDYRLDRMEMLLNHFEAPHRSMRIIHIAGSKGKGSTGLYLARGLTAMGEKTGLYSSPHVATYRERISMAGEFFNDELIVSEGGKILERLPEFTAEKLQGDAEPSAFELLTLLAFLVFRAAGCTTAVIETGIGGRLDATNVVMPDITLITPVELEHTDILGDTIPLIAAEKAGIIKKGVPVFVAGQRFPEALDVIRKRARERQAPLYYLPELLEDLRIRVGPAGTEVDLKWTRDFLTGTADTAENAMSAKTAEIDKATIAAEAEQKTENAEKKSGQGNKHPELPPKISITLSMLGTVQGENAALAITVLRKFPIIKDRDITSAVWQQVMRELSRARLPARMELLQKQPPVVIDGAHTPISTQHAIETFQKVFGEEGICIFGSVEGKNAAGMAALISGVFRDIIISTPGTFKPSNPGEVRRIFLAYNPDTSFYPAPEEALRYALELSGGNRPILVTGSFYMAAEIRKLILPFRLPFRKKSQPEVP